jgi:hypothetical protein
MGIFVTLLIAGVIGFYVYRIVSKSSKNVKDGKCITCDGHCSNKACDLNTDNDPE